MKYKKLGEECYIVMGQSPESKTYNSKKEGTPFLQGRKTFGRIYPYIDTWTTHPIRIGKKDSVLFSVRAPVGDINIATEEICIGRGLASISMKNKHNLYLYYLLINNKENIKNMSTGTVFESINRSELENLVLNFHEEEEQCKVEKLLGCLDKKIELNNQINDNLSEQLQLIFNEWFGKYNCNNIPNNWRIKKLKDIAAFSQGVQIPIEKQKDTSEDGYTRFIRIVDVTQKNDKDIRYIEDTERGKVSENEIFMIRYGTPGILSWNYNGIIANNLFKITPKDNTVSSNYLYSFLNAKPFQNYIKGNSTSSTMPAINFSTLNDIEVILPDKDSMDRFNEISETIRLKQLSIIEQNKTLSQLRDTLLPKLMNGEIDLNKIKI